MPGKKNWNPAIPQQLAGSEYSGVQPTLAGGIQPKGTDALDNGDLLRLGYITGNETSTIRSTNLEDRRQMLGLRPADGRNPMWLDDVSPTDDPRLTSEARRQGFGE